MDEYTNKDDYLCLDGCHKGQVIKGCVYLAVIDLAVMGGGR